MLFTVIRKVLGKGDILLSMLPQVRSPELRSQFEHRLEEQPRSPVETACSRLCVQTIDCEDDNFQKLYVLGVVPLKQVVNNYLFQTIAKCAAPCHYIAPLRTTFRKENDKTIR